MSNDRVSEIDFDHFDHDHFDHDVKMIAGKKGRKRGFGETRRESLVKVYHVMEAICKMEPAWMKVAESNFRLGSYKDANGQLRPCYQLTKTECLYIATKFNDEARAKLVLRWEELERAAPAHLST